MKITVALHSSDTELCEYFRLTINDNNDVTGQCVKGTCKRENLFNTIIIPFAYPLSITTR